MEKMLFNFEPRQAAWLRKEAKRQGVSAGEAIRRMVTGRMPQKLGKPRKLTGKTFETLVRGKGTFDGCTSIREMLKRLDALRDELLAMDRDGLVISWEVQDDYATLQTDNLKIAKQHAMWPTPEG